MNATGRAQARYLWVLFLACLFYPALLAAIRSPSTPGNNLHVPIIDLDLDAHVVLASGPAAICLLVLIVMGAIRATNVALKGMGINLDAPHDMERFDEHPNALELDIYTTSASPSWLAALLYLAYPIVVLAAIGEALWLWVTINHLSDRPDGWTIWSLIALLVATPAGWLSCTMLISRVRKTLHGQHKKPPPAVTTGAT